MGSFSCSRTLELFDFAWRGGVWRSFTYGFLHDAARIVSNVALHLQSSRGLLHHLHLVVADMRFNIPLVFDLVDDMPSLRTLTLEFNHCDLSTTSLWIRSTPSTTSVVRHLQFKATHCCMRTHDLHWVMERFRYASPSVSHLVLHLGHNDLDASVWTMLHREVTQHPWPALQQLTVEVTENRCGQPPAALHFPCTLSVSGSDPGPSRPARMIPEEAGEDDDTVMWMQ